MAAVASSQAAIAAAAAHQARVSQCKGMMLNFNAQTATVSEMREYAGCVFTVYPAPTGGNDMLAAKALFVIALIGMVIGAVRAKRDPYLNNFGDMAMTGLLWFLMLPCAVAFVAGVLYGIWRLLV